MSNALIVINNQKELLSIAEVFAKSGLFSDSSDIYKAAVKIQAGQELGIPPFAAMSQIHVIKGKPVIGGSAIASLIKKHPRYDYKAKMSDSRVEVFIFENGNQVGSSPFSMEDAKRANLTGKDNWKMYPRNMMFARAISNAARWYCPDIFGGSAVYTEDEINADYEVLPSVPTPPSNDTKPLEPDPCELAINAKTLAEWCENAYRCNNVAIAFSGIEGKIEAWYRAVVGEFVNDSDVNGSALVALQAYAEIMVDVQNSDMSKAERREATAQAFEHSKNVYNSELQAVLVGVPHDEEE